MQGAGNPFLKIYAKIKGINCKQCCISVKKSIFVLSFAMPPILVYKLKVHSTNTAILYYDVSNPLQTPIPWEQRWN
jgi:hypothetical protein